MRLPAKSSVSGGKVCSVVNLPPWGRSAMLKIFRGRRSARGEVCNTIPTHRGSKQTDQRTKRRDKKLFIICIDDILIYIGSPQNPAYQKKNVSTPPSKFGYKRCNTAEFGTAVLLACEARGPGLIPRLDRRYNLLSPGSKSICDWQVRIQKFSSGGGGSNLPKNFDEQIKKKRGEGAGFSIYWFSMVEIYFCHWNIFTDHNFYKMTSRCVFSRQNHIRGVCFSFLKCVSDFTGGGGGGSGVLPREIFGLNCVQSCNFWQNKHGTGTFMEAKDSVYDKRSANPFWTWKWFGFFKYWHYV